MPSDPPKTNRLLALADAPPPSSPATTTLSTQQFANFFAFVVSIGTEQLTRIGVEELTTL
jgi:hypothetical protein